MKYKRYWKKPKTQFDQFIPVIYAIVNKVLSVSRFFETHIHTHAKYNSKRKLLAYHYTTCASKTVESNICTADTREILV